jgi:hypothetical protein
MVDAMNVIGSRPDGWWRDRPGAMRKLAESLKALAAATGDEVAVAFEGSTVADLPAGSNGGLRVLHARRKGPNAADDRIVEEVAADLYPASLTVVTADRELSRRVRELGASVVGPSVLLAQLAELPVEAAD